MRALAHFGTRRWTATLHGRAAEARDHHPTSASASTRSISAREGAQSHRHQHPDVLNDCVAELRDVAGAEYAAQVPAVESHLRAGHWHWTRPVPLATSLGGKVMGSAGPRAHRRSDRAARAGRSA
jgi:hypothetical protein